MNLNFFQVCLVSLAWCFVVSFTMAYQVTDTPIQRISILPPIGARAIISGRIAKQREQPHGQSMQMDNPEIIKISKSPQVALEMSGRSENRRNPRFNVADGAYPVYYALAKANGSFRGNSIRWFRSE